MNDDSLDDLVALYRTAAREAPEPNVDARILQMADRANRPGHHAPQRWVWFTGAIAASGLLWLNWHHAALPPLPPAQISIGSDTPGYLDGRTRAYLLQMDITPTLSPSARYLMSQNDLPSH
jgi:hypothetical protein